MDPIKNMISAADPGHNDPSVPDGEAALRRMLTESGEFSDRLPRNVSSLADRKQRRARLAGDTDTDADVSIGPGRLAYLHGRDRPGHVPAAGELDRFPEAGNDRGEFV